jgi:hypothetical protein
VTSITVSRQAQGDDDELRVEQLTVSRQSIGQLVGTYGILEPPFDRESLEDEAYDLFMTVHMASPVRPMAYCGMGVWNHLTNELLRRHLARKQFVAPYLRLASLEIIALARTHPFHRALQRLDGVDMEDVVVIASLSESAQSAIHQLFGTP